MFMRLKMAVFARSRARAQCISDDAARERFGFNKVILCLKFTRRGGNSAFQKVVSGGKQSRDPLLFANKSGILKPSG